MVSTNSLQQSFVWMDNGDIVLIDVVTFFDDIGKIMAKVLAKFLEFISGKRWIFPTGKIEICGEAFTIIAALQCSTTFEG